MFTVEMGGLGPGYEQAIHVLVFETLRAHLEKHGAYPPTKESVVAARDKAVKATDKAAGGYSGAQVSAATNLAFVTLSKGWAAALETVPKDRLIQVSKRWPHA